MFPFFSLSLSPNTQSSVHTIKLEPLLLLFSVSSKCECSRRGSVHPKEVRLRKTPLGCFQCSLSCLTDLFGFVHFFFFCIMHACAHNLMVYLGSIVPLGVHMRKHRKTVFFFSSVSDKVETKIPLFLSLWICWRMERSFV